MILPKLPRTTLAQTKVYWEEFHSWFLKRERVMDVQAVKSLLMCIYEECESFYTYGTFYRGLPYLSHSKDKSGKKQVRRFYLKDKQESYEGL